MLHHGSDRTLTTEVSRLVSNETETAQNIFQLVCIRLLTSQREATCAIEKDLIIYIITLFI